MRFGLVLGEVFSGLRRNISMVISVILVTFVSLTFVGAAMLLQMQIQTMQGFFAERAQVAVYMCSSISESETCIDGEATEEQVEYVQGELEGDVLGPLIAKFEYDSKEITHEKAVEQAGSEDLTFSLEQSFAAFRITLHDPANTPVITEAFGGVLGVDTVVDQLRFLDPLFSALTVATYIAVGVAILMLIAAVLLVGTTIRLSAYARRKEIGIMRLVGASNRFIQTPFVLEGALSAFIGSLLASGAILACVHYGIEGYLRARVPNIPVWVGMEHAFIVVPVIVGIGIVLAALSAGFAIRRWLRA